MAENKKSFMLYCDSIPIIEKLSDERAGKLIKHIFRYCSDLDPVADDEVVDMAFEHFKAILKRDLKKYESIVERNRGNGSKGGRPSKNPINPVGFLETQDNPTKPKKADTDTDTDTDIKKVFMSKIKISDDEKFFIVDGLEIETTPTELKYFKTANGFRKLFIKNLTEKNAPTKTQENATYGNYVTNMRLMFEKDEVTQEQLREAFTHLSSKKGEFWKKNILSIEGLRKNLQKVLTDKNTNQTKEPVKPKLIPRD